MSHYGPMQRWKAGYILEFILHLLGEKTWAVLVEEMNHTSIFMQTWKLWHWWCWHHDSTQQVTSAISISGDLKQKKRILKVTSCTLAISSLAVAAFQSQSMNSNWYIRTVMVVSIPRGVCAANFIPAHQLALHKCNRTIYAFSLFSFCI